MTDYPGNRKHDLTIFSTGNLCKGKSKKTLKGDLCDMESETSRDQNATIESMVLAQTQTLNDQILSTFGRGRARDSEEYLK